MWIGGRRVASGTSYSGTHFTNSRILCRFYQNFELQRTVETMLALSCIDVLEVISVVKQTSWNEPFLLSLLLPSVRGANYRW